MTADRLPVVRVKAGTKVPLVMKVRERKRDSTDGELAAPVGAIFKVIGPSGTVEIAAGSPTYRGEGELVYYLDTTGFRRGNYEVQGIATMTLAGDKAVPKVVNLEVV